MSKLPKLKVKWWSLGEPEVENIYDFEQAKDAVFNNSSWILAFVEGEMIKTYEDLVQLAAREEYKDKEVLSVSLIVPVVGGG